MLVRLKNDAGIYFALLILFVAVATALTGGTTLALVILLEAGLLALAIALLRSALLFSGTQLGGWAFPVWLVLSVALAIAVALGSDWFAEMPGWILLAFGLYVVLFLGSEQLLTD